MEKIATENLFLLEFLVDNVNLNPKCDCALGEGERCVSFQFLDNAPLDVCEQDFSPSGKKQQSEKDSVKTGKSCLFSLSPQQATTAVQQFDVYVSIFKKMPAGWLPERVEVGEALISIANLFCELINSVETSDGTTPTAKTLKDAFDINSANGEVIGKIGVYIRMSCFGKLIVTQFQMNLEDKSVLFKDKEGKSLYRYKKAGKGGRKGTQDTCTPRRPSSAIQNQCPKTPCAAWNKNGDNTAGFNMTGMTNGMMNATAASPCLMVQHPGNGMGMSPSPFAPGIMEQAQMFSGGQPNDRPPINASCQECGAMPNAPCNQMQANGMMGMGGNASCQECGAVPNAPCAMGMGGNVKNSPCQECGTVPNAPCMMGMDGNYMMGMGMGMGMGIGGMGMGMGMGGPMSPCIECGNIPNAPCFPPQNYPYEQPGMLQCPSPKTRSSPCTECAGMEMAPCAESPDGNYQEIGASMGGNTLTIRVHKDKNKIEQIDPNAPPVSDSGSEAGCCCCPGRPGKKKKQQENAFNMRPGLQQGNQDMPFAFKMGKSGNPGGNNVVVNPPIATAPDGTKFTEFSDPNKELFILRVGKKSEGVDRKQNLELELCTPRGKML